MQKKFKMAMIAICGLPALSFAQEAKDSVAVSDTDVQETAETTDQVFTFSEAQLGEDDDMSQNVTVISSNTNVYASQVGYAFSPVRFRYRAMNQKYNDVYVNGMLLNDMETGQFRFSQVGGLNNQTRSHENSLPFEDNRYSLAGLTGSSNYNFRAGSMPAGHRLSIAGANRNYTLRGQYAFSTGFNNSGWAFSGGVSYRWADTKTAYVDGTFYNSLSYYLGVEKILGDHHLSLATWGNPTERASQGGATDEMYWLANNNFYNPYWGYQNGKVRSSRIVNDFAPTAVFTWDWNISDRMKLTTSLGGRYSMYKSTKLNYNNSDNPHPDYWKQMPSAYYNIANPNDQRNLSQPFVYAEEFGREVPEYWYGAYKYLSGAEANRQLNWDRLYAANKGANLNGTDAMYYIQAKRNDVLTLQLNSVLNAELSRKSHLAVGFGLGGNNARHYQTMEDLLGASSFRNINTYALSDYGASSSEVRYDLNDGPQAKVVGKGDVFGYDYYININKANGWAAYTADIDAVHFLLGGRIAYTGMQRDGKMRNGLAADHSYGKSGTASFLDGGLKASATANLGNGNSLMIAFGYDNRAPQASTVFAAPEINNDYCINIKNENDFSLELAYQLKKNWIALDLSAYYNYMNDVTEWQNYYFDDENSFTYVSLTGIDKVAYGVEGAVKLKLTSFLDFKALGTISQAKYLNNCNARYMMSTSGDYNETLVYSKGMHESGTPLTAASLGLAFHRNGWFVDVNANWYDRIYLSWSPSLRYESSLQTQGLISTGVDENGNISKVVNTPDQAKGRGGWMVDASVGKMLFLSKGRSISFNLSVTNILNNIKLCTGGYEQSRSSYTTNGDGSYSGDRIYSFLANPKKFYAYGTNGMLNVTYKF